MGFELSFAGLILSLVFTALTGLYPGGIIVPGYLVLFAEQPERIAGTLTASLMTYFCYRLISEYFILFGRRRFVFIILIGGLWTMVWIKFLPFLFPVSIEYRVIGWVIPGLIANNFERQGVMITTASLVVVTVASYFIGQFVMVFIN